MAKRWSATAVLAALQAASPASVAAFSPASIPNGRAAAAPPRGATVVSSTVAPPDNAITEGNPLRVLVAGAGVGGLAIANELSKNPAMDVTVLERTDEFKRFGGPIQLASNALQVIKEMDEKIYREVLSKFTYTGDKENGIKDGIRDEWYAKFDLASPAEARGMPYGGVIERPDLQQIYLDALPKGTVHNGDGVASYATDDQGVVHVTLESGKVVEGDVLVGSDGIWSSVRATMWDQPVRGDESGVTYSGYSVFAGELNYESFDNGQVGYKVYIGPQQYFVITDIGNGRYQWYAFLARAPGSAETEEKPDGSSLFLQNIFEGWSKDIHHILKATKENEIEQRDLYDRPPSVLKPWTKDNVALVGDSVHAMMPNLGQGGCQAIEDAFVLTQEIESAKSREEIRGKLSSYADRRRIRSAAVQGLSRFASDIIVQGFDTPAKIVTEGGLRLENFNYAGVVTRMLQPILPIFFTVQFNFLFEGWRNNIAIDLKATAGFLLLGGAILLVGAGALEETALFAGLGLEGLEGFAGFEGFESFQGFF